MLHGHNHDYRRHMEKVHAADGTTATMAFITEATAGAAPMPRDTDQSLPYIDWVDLNGNGTPDASEPVASAENNPFWDASAFGQWNWPLQSASGYISGTPDMFHAYGQEYTGGVRFSYSMFETGEDAQGQPTLTLTVKTVMWNGSDIGGPRGASTIRRRCSRSRPGWWPTGCRRPRRSRSPRRPTTTRCPRPVRT